MYYKIFFPNYSVNYLKKQTLIIECDFFLHIYKANVFSKKKKKVQSSERRWTGGNSPAVPLKAVSIEKDRAILPRYLWQAYGVKTILWIFSSLHSLLLHWDPDKRLCFEPHTSGKPKTAMDSNRNAQHTMLLL